MVRRIVLSLAIALASTVASADQFNPPADARCVALARLQLDHAIRLTQAEIAMLERRLVAYEPMTRFKNAGPLVVTYDETRLALYERQLYLEQLRLAGRTIGRSRAW